MLTRASNTHSQRVFAKYAHAPEAPDPPPSWLQGLGEETQKRVPEGEASVTLQQPIM